MPNAPQTRYQRLATIPAADHPRWYAQAVRAEWITDGLCLPTTFVSRIILPDLGPCYCIIEPRLHSSHPGHSSHPATWSQPNAK